MKLTIDDFEVYKVVSTICVKYQVDPDTNIRDFINKILSKYDGDDDLNKLKFWLEGEIPKHFIAVNERPIWIQNPDWPVHNGTPMIFVAQREVTNQDFFHDTTVFYIFIPLGDWSDDEIKIISQQY